MLEYKLKRSKQKSNNAALILLVAAVILLAFGGLFTAVLIFSPQNHEEQPSQVETSDPERQAAPSGGMLRNSDPDVLDAEERTPTPSPLVQPRQGNGETRSMEAAREAFKSMLHEYESTIRALVEAPEFASWDEFSQARFLRMKDRVLSDFGAGEYVRARDELAELIRQATEVIGERDAAVVESIEQTKAALQEDAPQKALAHFSRAEELAPNSPDVLALEPRVTILPQVVELLEQARLAQVQGDPKSELRAWKEITKIDPARRDARERIDAIQGSFFQQALSAHLQKTMAAIEARQPDVAQASLDKARKMAPKRDEVVHLQREIDTLAREIRYSALIDQAKAAEARDDWSGVLSAYNNAAAINRSSAEVASGIKRARTILGIRAAINEKLGKPYRLSTKVGEKQARQLLQSASGIFELSPSVMVLAQKLEGLLHVYTTPVKVRITSDGKTFVQVKGVGKVGKVTEKDIQLRPGRYTFEGKREGFVSKAITVDIPPSGEPMEVHVVCENTI